MLLKVKFLDLYKIWSKPKIRKRVGKQNIKHMKKVILVAIVVVAGLSASCKKSYSCTCYNANTGNSSTSTVKAYTITGAATACDAKGTDCSL